MPTTIARSRSEELIVELNAANQIIDERDGPAAFNSRRMLDLLPETVVDKRTLLVLEIHDLFQAIGGNTLMVTHSFELVEHFQRQDQGLCLQAEFDGEQPTHRMIEGVSRQSHALRVAKKIGFAPEDIRKHLIEHGYDQPLPPRAAQPQGPANFSCRRDRKKI